MVCKKIVYKKFINSFAHINHYILAMCKKIIRWSCYFISAILFVVAIYFIANSYMYSKEADNLVKVYYIGGVISGFFAFGAFFVAVSANRIQNKTGNLQRFETTFFNMLNLQQQITNDLIYNEDISDDDDSNTNKYQIIQGRELFHYFWNTLHLRSLSEESGKEDNFGYEESPFIYRNGLKSLIEDFGSEEYECQKIPSYFDHYFRHLYTIIKFVHNTDFLTWEEKYKYTSIVRATLSRYELVWIYYNCLYGAGVEKFKPLVEEYSLLKNMRENLLALSKENKDVLSPKNKIISAKKQFSGTDYEFYLADDKHTDKYHISAFYSKKELSKGRELINQWVLFLNE